MPGSPGFSLALVPVRGFAGLKPVGLSDIADYEGAFLPVPVKESWLLRVLPLLSLVRRRSVDRRHRHVEQPQVHAQLRPVVDVVVEDERA